MSLLENYYSHSDVDDGVAIKRTYDLSKYIIKSECGIKKNATWGKEGNPDGVLAKAEVALAYLKFGHSHTGVVRSNLTQLL